MRRLTIIAAPFLLLLTSCVEQLKKAETTDLPPTGKRTLVVVESNLPFDLDQDAELSKIIAGNYDVKRVILSSSYDEKLMRENFAASKKLPGWNQSLTFEDYLRKRNTPMNEASMENIRRYGITKTPELVVVSPEGKVVDHYLQHHGDYLFEMILKQKVSTRWSDDERRATLWSLMDADDYDSVKRFLTLNAR